MEPECGACRCGVGRWCTHVVRVVVVCKEEWVSAAGRRVMERKTWIVVQVVAVWRNGVGTWLHAGVEGVGRVFMDCPEIMLCKPSGNDRWDRRAVELAAYRWRYGHVNVPEVTPTLLSRIPRSTKPIDGHLRKACAAGGSFQHRLWNA